MESGIIISSSDYGQTVSESSQTEYAIEVFSFNDAITPYGVLETKTPPLEKLTVDDFRDGQHFRTAAETTTNSLILQLEDRLISVICDQSGSMTWNDVKGDRFTYLKRLLGKLDATYPGKIQANLITFGGSPTKTKMFVVSSGIDFLGKDANSFSKLLQHTFEDSIFDFSGVRVVRRTDRFPNNPSDGVVVADGIIDAVKDENLVEGQTYYYGVWTFNRDHVFSDGQFIKITPFDRILPQGVNFATATARILPGVKRDNNTQLIYNLAEKSGFIVFDSSGNAKHGVVGDQVLEDAFWSGDSSSTSFYENRLRKPVGVKFDGEFDIVETSYSDHAFDFVGEYHIDSLAGSLQPQSITWNVWVFRHVADSPIWLIGTSKDEATDEIGFAVGIDTDGTVLYQTLNINTGFSASTNAIVNEKQWTMLTVVVTNENPTTGGAIKFYLDGVKQHDDHGAGAWTSKSFSGEDSGGLNAFVNRLYIGAKPTDNNTQSQNYVADFFGSLAQISIHNVARDDSYIQDLYDAEKQLFTQSISSSEQNPIDNTQREVLLSWNVGNDFNYQNGDIKVIRKYRTIPDHENDGQLVLLQSAAPGQFLFLDSFDFTNNSDYYYRIFTSNALGITCDRTDARILSVHIPKSANVAPDPYEELSIVSNESIITGNKKLLLQWTNPTSDTRWVGTKIYFGKVGFPTVNIASQGSADVSNGIEIVDTKKTFFVHRVEGLTDSGTTLPLDNGITYYYSLVTYDRLGNLSAPVFLSGVPSDEIDTPFQPEDVQNLYGEIINPETISLHWDIPMLKTEDLDLYMGDAASIFVSVRDVFGGNLDDINNLQIKVCTKIEERRLKTDEKPLRTGGNNIKLSLCSNSSVGGQQSGECQFSVKPRDCNGDREKLETVLNYSTVSSGLIKGLLTHTTDRQIISRRSKYTMDIWAQYAVQDEESQEKLFEFNTKPTRVTFKHPVQISLVNKLNKKVTIECDGNQDIRGPKPCACPDEETSNACNPESFNGGYVRATQPYVCRVEIQFKGKSLPNGTPVNVRLFKHEVIDNVNVLRTETDRTTIREGTYQTIAVNENEVDNSGNPTGRLVSKSVVDVEIPHPSLPDFVDLYVALNYVGFFIDAVHEVRFVGSLFLTANIHTPAPDGIDVAEQFATVYTVHPDYPNDVSKRLPAPDGTLVKWELLKLRHGKERPFYSTDLISELLSGVYSSTLSGIANNVFFGPIGNIQNHVTAVNCGPGGSFTCCIGEEYAIRTSVILGDYSATETQRIFYDCTTGEQSTNRRFLMNADPLQPRAKCPQSAPHWLVWADGDHMLKFQIASNPALSQMYGADCFRRCVEDTVGGQLIPLPDDQIVQISAPAEVLWNVVFDDDPYTGLSTLVSYESVAPNITEGVGTPLVANIPVNGSNTDFYIRLNSFIGDYGNPHPKDCEPGGQGGSSGILSCEWKGICSDSDCIPQGIKWVNVRSISGTTTLMANNKELTMTGGGTYETGIPPIYIGFLEPLDVRIIDARVNGERVNELVVDNISYHTFTVEVKFANQPVPDGTPIEITVSGKDQNIVILSNCSNAPTGCSPVLSGVIFTQLINDPVINPQNDDGTIEPRSLAYFSINPLPNIAFNAKVNATCRYDKLNKVKRKITRCIEVNNTINTTLPDQTPVANQQIEKSTTSNEAIVYDTLQDKYESTRAGLVQRSGQFAASVVTGTQDFIYVFGGYTGATNSSTTNITPFGEYFDAFTQTWSFTVDMPTPRAFGSTVVVDNKIYCIGGVEADPILSQYNVSRKVEVFDISSESWNTTIKPMPEAYGVAYGDAQVVGDHIYVTCGVTTILDNSRPNTLNDRILRYSIADDEWIIIVPSDENLYKRLSPFGFFRSNPLLPDVAQYYVYGGSIPKTRDAIDAERNSQINRLLNEFRSFILGSNYFINLTSQEQDDYIQSKEEEITNRVSTPAFVYPSTGFSFIPGSEIDSGADFTIELTDTISQEWRVLPKPRDMGRCIYIHHQDIVYFIGGSNQNQSTTLNRVESINFRENNMLSKLTSMNRGRTMFAAVSLNDDIYLLGGQTSGHKTGFVEIDVQQFPDAVEARGSQSCGILITMRDDSGDIINENIRVSVRGRLRMPELDSVLSEFFAKRAADRALGGDGTGNALDESAADDTLDVDALIKAQNKINDPSSDEFQFNAARKLGEQVFLFPILYSQTEIIVNGVGGISLLPRSEDPLSDFAKLAEFIQVTLKNTPPDPNEKFEGDLTRDELAALGESLLAIKLPPTIIDSESLRSLYSIETTVTVLDDFYFGQTVSDFDLNIQEKIRSRIITLLTPTPADSPDSPASSLGITNSGTIIKESECFVLQHAATPDVPVASTPPQDRPNNPGGTGGFAQSGQCLFCDTILPLNPQIRKQSPTVTTEYFNIVDWVPQITKHFTTNDTDLSDVIRRLEIIDHETPFGGSQIFDTLFAAAALMPNESFVDRKKSIYVASDNSPNLCLVSRRQAIEEVNAIDGDKNVPVVYTVFSTAFPVSLATQLERTEIGDVEKIVHETGGQSAMLVASRFLDQVLNLTIGGATGGLGYGLYTRQIDLGELSAITGMTLNFELPVNTNGFVRFRHSMDSYNFGDFSERFSGNQTIDFTDFFAKIIELEVVLTTGFTADVTEEYDSTPTGIPKLISIALDTSGEREDFIFLNTDNAATNIQQVAAAFDGDIPTSSIVEIGVATSASSNWNDFHSMEQPSVIEHGKIFMLNRTLENNSIVSLENLKRVDGLLYKLPYSSYDPQATVKIFEVKNKVDVEVTSGFVLYPRQGEVYFDTRQPANKVFKVSIVNGDDFRVGIRLRNRLHTESITVRGVGYIYSTNDNKPAALSQIAPRAINVSISPENPTAGDVFFGLYQFVDINNDKEKGTIISWFKNNTQLLEIQNKTSWSNLDLLLSHKLQPGDKIKFSVAPSDGRDFGTTVNSPAVTILARQPGVSSAKIIPLRNGIINSRFDTSSVFSVEYNFVTDDSGASSVEHGTTIKWFVSGRLFKEGVFSADESDPYTDPKSVLPTEVGNGVSAHVIGNQIYVEITPKTRSITGPTLKTTTIVVENSVPIAKDVVVAPNRPTIQSTLLVTYSIDDQDITKSVQTDQSEIKWFSSPNGINFSEVSELRGQRTVPPFYTRAGEQWFAQVSPFDSLDIGEPISSKKVTIQSA